MAMTFSPSTFTIEIDAVPTVAFQAKWQADADQICKEWLHTHWDQLSSLGPGGLELPPVFKLRLARAAEKSAYEAERGGFEFCGEIKIVRLIELSDASATEPEQPPHNGSRSESAKDSSDHHTVDEG